FTVTQGTLPNWNSLQQSVSDYLETLAELDIHETWTPVLSKATFWTFLTSHGGIADDETDNLAAHTEAKMAAGKGTVYITGPGDYRASRFDLTVDGQTTMFGAGAKLKLTPGSLADLLRVIGDDQIIESPNLDAGDGGGSAAINISGDRAKIRSPY